MCSETNDYKRVREDLKPHVDDIRNICKKPQFKYENFFFNYPVV